LEGSLEGIDERVVKLRQNLFFQLDVFHLLQVYDVRLRDLFKGKDLFGGADYLFDSAEGASSQCFSYFVF
jgi:hypothetical protein